MASFPYFQKPADLQPKAPKFPNESLSLSVVLQYAETAKTQSFTALCRLGPLVKSYRGSIASALQDLADAGSKLGEEVEVPSSYTAALSLVQERFQAHLGALDGWTDALSQHNEVQAEKAMTTVGHSGKQLESALQGLSTNH